MVKRTSIKYPLVSEYISIYNAEDHSIYSWNGIGIEYFDGNGTPIYVENAIDNATTRTDDALKLGMGEFLEFEFILPEEYLSKMKKIRLTSIMELPTNSQKNKRSNIY